MRERHSGTMNSTEESINGCSSTSSVSENLDKYFEIDSKAYDSNDSNSITSKSEPDIEIIFRNQQCARKYQDSLETYLKGLLVNKETYNFTVRLSAHKVNKDDIDDMFCIDKVSSSPAVTSFEDSGSIAYTSPFSTPVLCKSNEAKSTPKSGRKSCVCFNCLGEHYLKDCPVEHDFRRIAKNRKEFLEQNTPTRRYHDDLQNTSSMKKMIPGIISNDLRRALGLRSHQLPMHIYHMRVLGYPPGWLSDAEVETSGITLFDSENEAKEKPSTSKYDNQKPQYDFKKFASYPGFNCDLPYGVRDDHLELGMPALQPHQMLSEAIKHTLVTTTATDVYKKKKQSFPEREPKKQKSDSSSEESSFNKSTVETESTTFSDKSTEKKTNKSESINDSAKKDNKESPRSPKETSLNDVDEMGSPSVFLELGVPIIETPNACKKLPQYSKFSEGISEHENFENLPDATGTYDQMRGILDSVRQKLFEKS